MKRRIAMMAAVVLPWSSAVVPVATSQETFPDAPGRDTLYLACTQCHSLGKMVVAELSKDDWEFIVYDMIGRGAPVHEEELRDLVAYVQDNFATDK